MRYLKIFRFDTFLHTIFHKLVISMISIDFDVVFVLLVRFGCSVAALRYP